LAGASTAATAASGTAVGSAVAMGGAVPALCLSLLRFFAGSAETVAGPSPAATRFFLRGEECAAPPARLAAAAVAVDAAAAAEVVSGVGDAAQEPVGSY